MLTSVHAVAAETVVAAAEIWLATKVSAAVTTLSDAAAIATTASAVSFAVAFSHRHQCRRCQRRCHFHRLF
jgi:hypothetical protein